MPIKLKKISRPNPMNRAETRYYLTQASQGTVTMKQLAGDVERYTALSEGDAQSALLAFAKLMPNYLGLGQSVALPGLGTIRISVSCEGTLSPEELKVSHIKQAKIIFTPAKELKKLLGDLSYEIVTSDPQP